MARKLNNVNKDYITAICSAIGNTSAKGYKAHFKRTNGDIGITAEYSKDILMLVIEEILEIDKGSKLIKVSAV